MEADLKAVQKRELEILKEVVEICDRHGIRYFADCGTCLGAVRHQGFIPWDDDVDIGMLREDFDRFREIARAELPDYLELQDFEEVKDSHRFFIKVHDSRTAFVEAPLTGFRGLYTGVYIDILCYDGYPAPGLRRKWVELRMGLLWRINWLLRSYALHDTLWDKARYAMAVILRRMLPFNWASLRMERISRRYKAERYEDTVMRLRAFCMYVIPRRCLMETVKLPFEGMELACPKDWDVFLRSYYGDDYMTPPPEDKRGPRHPVAYFSMEKSYREYL